MTETTATRSVLVRIAGRVQGVGFRDWTQRRAAALGLSGWVRNLANGDVEALVSGSAGAVTTMLKVCRDGPRHARVDSVKVREAEEPAAGPFTIRQDR
jgi:acylphosphatase